MWSIIDFGLRDFLRDKETGRPLMFENYDQAERW